MSSITEKTFGNTAGEIESKGALEYAPVGILIFSKDYKIKYVNNNFFKFPGVVEGNPNSLTNKSIYENRLFENIDIRNELDELRENIAFEKELTVSRTLSGNKISVLMKCSPIVVENDFQGGVIILEDIKFATENSGISLLYSQQFQNFLFYISDCYFFVDAEGNIKTSSPRGYEEYDFLFEPGSIIKGTKPSKLSGILFKKHLEQLIESNKTIWTEIPYLKKSQEQKAIITFIPLTETERKTKTFLMLVRKDDSDVSQSIAEEEIKELRRYQNIVTDFLDSVIGVDNNGNIIFWNESSARIFGLTRSEVFGKFVGKIFPSIDQTYFELIKKRIKEQKIIKETFKIGEEESTAEYFSVSIVLV